MANQQYIANLEEKIIQVGGVLKAIREGMAAERKANSPGNYLNTENASHYATLALNLDHIGQQCVDLATEIGIRRTEFVPAPKQKIEKVLSDVASALSDLLKRPDIETMLALCDRQTLDKASLNCSLISLRVDE